MEKKRRNPWSCSHEVQVSVAAVVLGARQVLKSLKKLHAALQLSDTCWADGLCNLHGVIRLHELEMNKFYEGSIIKRVPAGTDQVPGI